MGSSESEESERGSSHVEAGGSWVVSLQEICQL